MKNSKFKIQNSKLRNSEFLHSAFCILHSRRGGFTLIEIVMIIVVISIAIPALLIILGQGTRQSVDAELQVSATNVAQALMEEIKTKRWDENSPIPPGTYTTTLGPELPGEPWDITHSNYDDVDDYHNLYANSGNTDAVTIGGVTYTRDVQVCYVQASDLNTCVDSTTTDYKRIRVTATNPNLGSVELVTLVTNY
jgi:MSHA pilin protein MshD